VVKSFLAVDAAIYKVLSVNFLRLEEGFHGCHTKFFIINKKNSVLTELLEKFEHLKSWESSSP
jgi:hypothetical protein